MGAYSDRVIADGASYYWRLGETVGTTAVDIAGGANGTISGGVTLGAAGALSDGNKAMTFDGATGQVVTAVNVTVPVATTIEGWIRNTDTSIPQPFFSTTGGVGGLFVGTLNNVIQIYNNDASLFGNGFGAVSDGQWHHLVCVFNGTTVAIYRDGALENTQAFARPAASTTTVAKIALDTTFTRYWLGSIDEVAIYPRALSAAEIAAHYTLGLGQSPPNNYRDRVQFDGASHYWRLGETVGTTAVDAVGGANGTISGGVTLGAVGAIGDGTKAMTFDGATGQIVTASTVATPATVTIEMWVNYIGIPSYVAVFANRSTAAMGLWIGVFSNRTVVFQDATEFQGAAALNNGLWHQVVVVLTATTVSIYVDGGLDRTGPMVRSVDAGGVAGVGVDGNRSGTFFPGSIDEVAIYPRALTAPEIAAHYTLATSAGGGVRTLSFGYWKQRWPAA